MKTRNPLGLGLVITGALAIALGTFLPFQESPRFREIEQNTLIQNPSGWVLIALALGIVVTGYRVGQGLSTKWWQPTLLSVGAGALGPPNRHQKKACGPCIPLASTVRSTPASRVSFRHWALPSMSRGLVR